MKNILYNKMFYYCENIDKCIVTFKVQAWDVLLKKIVFHLACDGTYACR